LGDGGVTNDMAIHGKTLCMQYLLSITGALESGTFFTRFSEVIARVDNPALMLSYR